MWWPFKSVKLTYSSLALFCHSCQVSGYRKDLERLQKFTLYKCNTYTFICVCVYVYICWVVLTEFWVKYGQTQTLD